MKNNSGITLIEVAILVLILGLIAVPMMHLYKIFREEEIAKRSQGNPIVIQSALQKYVLRNGRYPRPAPRDVPVSDAAFGQQGPLGGYPACAPGITAVCRANGFRDFADAGTTAGDGPDEKVLIGDLPYAELGLPLYYQTDGYGSKFTYAVTESMTNGFAGPFVDANGVIRLRDGRAGFPMHTGTNSNLHYIIVMHGSDARGAFSPEGVLIAPCTGAGLDLRNCDNNGEFFSNFNMLVEDESGSPKYVRQVSAAAGANHYDDFVVYATSTAIDIWSRTVGTPDIYSRNAGNIRIGAGTGPGATTNPAARVHVMGNVQTQDVKTNRLCAQTGCPAPGSTGALTAPNNYPPNVFTPSIIAGPVNPNNESINGGGISCYEAGLTGISNSNEVCSTGTIPIPASTRIILGNCPPGTWPRGTNGSGGLSCGTP